MLLGELGLVGICYLANLVDCNNEVYYLIFSCKFAKRRKFIKLVSTTVYSIMFKKNPF